MELSHHHNLVQTSRRRDSALFAIARNTTINCCSRSLTLIIFPQMKLVLHHGGDNLIAPEHRVTELTSHAGKKMRVTRPAFSSSSSHVYLLLLIKVVCVRAAARASQMLPGNLFPTRKLCINFSCRYKFSISPRCKKGASERLALGESA